RRAGGSVRHGRATPASSPARSVRRTRRSTRTSRQVQLGRNLVQFCAMSAGSGIESPSGVGARAGEGEGPESLFVKLLAGRLGTELHPTLAPELGGPHGERKIG